MPSTRTEASRLTRVHSEKSLDQLIGIFARGNRFASRTGMLPRNYENIQERSTKRSEENASNGEHSERLRRFSAKSDAFFSLNFSISMISDCEMMFNLEKSNGLVLARHLACRWPLCPGCQAYRVDGASRRFRP